MSRRDSLGTALDGVVRVLMISAPRMDMVETHCTFIDACKSAGVRYAVKFSSLDARSNTTFPFGLMHKANEEHLEQSGLAWTHLRPAGFRNNRDTGVGLLASRIKLSSSPAEAADLAWDWSRPWSRAAPE